MKEVSLNLLEETLKKLLNLLSKHENTKQIISFIKQLLIGANIDMKEKLLIKIKEALNNLNFTKNKAFSEEFTAINLIKSYITEKLQPSKNSSHSPLIQSFATELHNDSNFYSNLSQSRISAKK